MPWNVVALITNIGLICDSSFVIWHWAWVCRDRFEVEVIVHVRSLPKNRQKRNPPWDGIHFDVVCRLSPPITEWIVTVIILLGVMVIDQLLIDLLGIPGVMSRSR